MEKYINNIKSTTPDEDLWILSLMDGSISKEDFESLKAWTYASSEHRNYVRQRVEALFSMGVLNDNTSFYKEEAYNRFLNRVSAAESSECPLRVPLFTWKTVAVAAALALLVFLPWTGYKFAKTSMKGSLTQIEMKTAEGSSSVVSLPDGTLVTLGPESRICYSPSYGIENREVVLYGEGHFLVRHSSDMEFQVKSGVLTVTDKGTEFRVRNYDTENTATVELLKGKILLDNSLLHVSDSSLKSGEHIVVDKKSGQMVKAKVAKDTDSTYILTFEDMQLEKVVAILSKAYGVKIHISKMDKKKLFNGVFDRRKDSLAKILDSMSATQQVEYREEMGEYYIY